MVNINGRLLDKEQAVISVFDHGFLYGEGIYEVVRTYDGVPFLFDRHMRRLRNSGAMIRLDPANRAYDPQRYAPTQVRVQGRLAGILRRYS